MLLTCACVRGASDRDLFLNFFDGVEEFLRRKQQQIGGRMLKGDHSFKVPKLSFVNGEREIYSIYTVLNEYSEVRVLVLSPCLYHLAGRALQRAGGKAAALVTLGCSPAQVVTQGFFLTKTAEELRPLLLALRRRFEMLGLEFPDWAWLDDCCESRKLWLVSDAGVASKCPYHLLYVSFGACCGLTICAGGCRSACPHCRVCFWISCTSSSG